ncbi:hypothetical protein BJV82DRAFT_670096 [Fennellomyces sp. T-0311]|nr:hypothetical protein BJV82DRAFT_670096 [Fennellomyces sp. T-0311]
MKYSVLALAGLLPLGICSSSFVYEDVAAHPRYRVVLTEDKIPESAVYADIQADEESDKDDALSTHFTYSQAVDSNQVIMMSAYGQPFQCTIPTVDEQVDRSVSSHKEEPEDTQKIIERGLKLLEPLSKACLFYHKPGYWTYEYCHKKHVRQFHVDRSTIKTEPPARTPHGQSFYLGFFAPNSGQQTDVAEPTTTLRHVGDQRFLTQRWTGGSDCDLTGKPRTIEVQFHCDMNAHDGISMFQEVTTCQYQMVITTPRLCEEMMLASQTQSDVNKIQCNPIVPDHMLTSSSPAHQLEEQATVKAAPAEPELEPEVQHPPQEEQDKQTVLKEPKQETTDSKQEETKENLLQMISELTDQINELQRQVTGSSNAARQGEEDMEVAFFHVDENGVLVPEEGVDMKTLVASYMKLLDSTKDGPADKSQQKPASEQETEQERAQQRNRKAYEMTYFQ